MIVADSITLGSVRCADQMGRRARPDARDRLSPDFRGVDAHTSLAPIRGLGQAPLNNMQEA